MITLTASRWKADDEGGWIVAGAVDEWCDCDDPGCAPAMPIRRGPPAWMVGSDRVIDLAVPCLCPCHTDPEFAEDRYDCDECDDGRVVKRVWFDGPPLPMHDGGTKLDAYPDDALYFTKGEGWWRDTDFDKIIDLPSAARPGMYAQHVIEVTP